MKRPAVDKKLLKRHFSRGALIYDDYSSVQKGMAERLAAFLNENRIGCGERLSVLDIGCGTGLLMGKILELYPDAGITAVDIAPGMIKEARKKYKLKNIQLICGDIETMDFSAPFDLIVSSAAFQWMNDIRGTLVKIKGWLKKSGWLCFSTFGDATFHEFYNSYHEAAQSLDIADYNLPGLDFFGFSELKKICGELFHPENFSIQSFEEIRPVSFANAREALDSVRKIGAGNPGLKRHSQKLVLLKEAIRLYDERFQERPVTLTYHPVYFLIKPQR